MHQLVYTSTAREGLNSEEIFRIVEQSARNNPSVDITGFLVMRDGQFLQLVEGPLTALEDLLARLAKDDRHHSIRVLQRAPVATRSFPKWRMKRLSDGEAAVAELEGALSGEGTGKIVPPVVRQFILQQMAA